MKKILAAVGILLLSASDSLAQTSTRGAEIGPVAVDIRVAQYYPPPGYAYPPPGYAYPPPTRPPPCSAVTPGPFRGAARGAAGGALFGAIAGNAGRGAAIGAGVAGIAGAVRHGTARSVGACY